MAVSSKAGPISSSINLLERRSDFREAFCTNSKPHLKKMQLGNCAGEKSSSLLEGSVKGNIVGVKNNAGFSRKNSEFPQFIAKREKNVYKSVVTNFETALDRVMTDRNDFLVNGSNSQTRVRSLVGPAVGDGEYLRRSSAAHGEPALRAYIERLDQGCPTSQSRSTGRSSKPWKSIAGDFLQV